MSETCIVCLGDLGENASALPLPADELVNQVDALPPSGGDAVAVRFHSHSQSPNSATSSAPSDAAADLIAYLPPCGHYLHNECLKPWAERANSCPICRQAFNLVELVKNVGGPVISSYPVQDRIQVAEVDPTLLVDYALEEELESTPCQICGLENDEHLLLLCDGCAKPFHTYCLELDGVPAGDWYCEQCEIQQALAASLAQSQSANSSSRSHGRRTRADYRRDHLHILHRQSDWARIWSSVRDRMNIDLDFPFHNETESTAPRSRTGRISERRAWEQRLRVAEEQGGSRQLRNIAPNFDADVPTMSRPRPEPEEPESMEEIMAWNAMEKARDMEANPGSLARKRRRTESVTASPASPQPTPDPVPRKRPRIRRGNDTQAVSSGLGESSVSHRAPTLNRSILADNTGAPSFLQSLLKEVESSNTTEDEPRGRPRLTLRPVSDHASPQASSPEASPTSSVAPSPRAGSVSPAPKKRSGSPHLTSSIEPIYPHIDNSGELSPVSPVQMSPERPKLKPKSRAEIAHRTRAWVEEDAEDAFERKNESSPTRSSMPLSIKEKIQRFVKEALREPYHNSQVDKDQYTTINRNVSRMLYEKVGEDGSVDGDESTELQRFAHDEVTKELASLERNEKRGHPMAS